MEVTAAAAVTLDKGIGLHQNRHPVSLLGNLQSAEAVESGVRGAASDPAVLCSGGGGQGDNNKRSKQGSLFCENQNSQNNLFDKCMTLKNRNRRVPMWV